MANPEHLAKLREGVAAWNAWRVGSGLLTPDLSDADLRGATLRSLDLGFVNLRGARLERVDLRGTMLWGADLSGAGAAGADLRGALLVEASLFRADLRGADLRGSELRGAYLRHADLRDADLAGGELRDGDLLESDLRGATLGGVDLRLAELRGARFGARLDAGLDLSATRLQAASLEGAQLRDARGLQVEQLAGATLAEAELAEALQREFAQARDALNAAVRSARRRLLGLGALCTASFAALLATPDAALVTSLGTWTLPVLGTEASLRFGYQTAAVLLLAAYAWFHGATAPLWLRAARLPARSPDGRWLDEQLSSRLFAGLLRAHVRRIRLRTGFLLRPRLETALLWGLIPVTLAALESRYLVTRDASGARIPTIALGVALAIGGYAYVCAARALRTSGIAELGRWSLRRASKAFCGAACLTVLFVCWEQPAPDRAYRPEFANAAQLAGARLSAAVPDELEGEQLSSEQLAAARPMLPLTRDLRGVNAAGVVWVGADLRGVLLERANFHGADLRGARLSNTRLREASLSAARLGGADLRGATLTDARLDQAQLAGAQLQGALLEKTDLSGANLRDSRLNGAYLSGSYLNAADLRGASLRGANLAYAKLENADLRGTDLRETNLDRAFLSGTIIDEGTQLDDKARLVHRLVNGPRVSTSLRGADLIRTVLYEVDLAGRDLRETRFEQAMLSRAQLRDANLAGADLGGADLGHADLSGANLRRANLANASIYRANLSGADLREARGLYGDDLHLACGDDRTAVSAGVDAPPKCSETPWAR